MEGCDKHSGRPSRVRRFRAHPFDQVSPSSSSPSSPQFPSLPSPVLLSSLISSSSPSATARLSAPGRPPIPKSSRQVSFHDQFPSIPPCPDRHHSIDSIIVHSRLPPPAFTRRYRCQHRCTHKPSMPRRCPSLSPQFGPSPLDLPSIRPVPPQIGRSDETAAEGRIWSRNTRFGHGCGRRNLVDGFTRSSLPRKHGR